MKKINDEILTAIFNSFYSRRFTMVGYTVRRLIDDGVNCREMPSVVMPMTVFGFFISKYPSLLPAMEKIDEFDLISRAKMLDIVKKTTPLSVTKRKKADIKELDKSKEEYANYSKYRGVVANGRKSRSVAVFGV